MSGIVGRFFYQFGITIAVSVLVSLFVAFTLTPMLASRWLRPQDEDLSNEGNYFRRGLYLFNRFFDTLSKRYRRAITWSLAHRRMTLGAALGLFALSFVLMRFLGSDFFPESDQSEFTIGVNASPGTSLEQTAAICERIEAVLHKRPEVTTLLTTIGAGNDPITKGNILVKLVKKAERKQGIKTIMTGVRRDLLDLAGANLSILVAQGPGGGTKPVIMSVRGEDLSKLEQLGEKVERIVRATPEAVDVENSYEISKPEIRIRIDREKASDLGLSVGLIASSIRAMVDGAVATQYAEGGEQYDVRVRLRKEDRTSLENVGNLTIKSSKDTRDQQKIIVPISYVASVGQGSGPSKINRYDRQREIRIDANTSGHSLGEVLGSILKQTAGLPLEPGYSVDVTGTGQTQSESFVNILISLGLAIVFVYIVLAAQFESFWFPFAIMLALPMSLIGAVIALLIFGNSLSVISLIGIIMLMGLVTKNGILLVDYTGVLRDRGSARTEALVEAGATRLRPILMTTFAMIFGMVPIAFSSAEGSEFRSPMGQAVIGGLITSTLLTLFVVPVVYSLIDDFSLRGAFGWILRLLPRPLRGKRDAAVPAARTH
jgi:HAE1 family hydrophobic/amphiphilic exporter-1